MTLYFYTRNSTEEIGFNRVKNVFSVDTAGRHRPVRDVFPLFLIPTQAKGQICPWYKTEQPSVCFKCLCSVKPAKETHWALGFCITVRLPFKTQVELPPQQRLRSQND